MNEISRTHFQRLRIRGGWPSLTRVCILDNHRGSRNPGKVREVGATGAKLGQ